MTDEPAIPPDIVLGPLKIWIGGRERPASQDLWDGNWLKVDARCSSPESAARVSGSIIHLTDIRQWVAHLRRLAKEVPGEASLGCTEPDLEAVVRLEKLGNGHLVVQFRRHGMESHQWTFPVDQSYLPAWIDSRERVLVRYPIRGEP